MPVVLDASAYLAYLGDEPGADVVEAAIAAGDLVISTVNILEVLNCLSDERPEVARVLERDAPRQELTELPRSIVVSGREWPLYSTAITLEPFTEADAWRAAVLRPLTRGLGLSFGGRACLALAHRLGAPALTADPSWLALDSTASGVEIRLIQG